MFKLRKGENMLTSVYTIALTGVEGDLIRVEVDISNRTSFMGNCWTSRY